MKPDLDKWAESLKPENLTGNLISCALYIASYESFTDNIVDQVRMFYSSGLIGGEFITSSEYETKVLKGNKKHPIYATLLWFKEKDVILEDDLLQYESLKKYRNKLSHEMTSLLFDDISKDFVANFSALHELRIKIEKWWMMNIEIPTGVDLDHKEVKEEDVVTKSEWFYKMINDIISGDEETSTANYKEFEKRKSGF